MNNLASNDLTVKGEIAPYNEIRFALNHEMCEPVLTISEEGVTWKGEFVNDAGLVYSTLREFFDHATGILKAEHDKLKAENERYEEALKRLEDWAKAYPVKIFHEPTKEEWHNIHFVLKDAGYSLDAVSASNMRHVITGVQDILDEALRGEGGE